MIERIFIKDFAIIREVGLPFYDGLTVITGETGAGKSILLDALDALFVGSQVSISNRMLRSGCDRGQIEAEFSINESVQTWLKDYNFDFLYCGLQQIKHRSLNTQIVISIKLFDMTAVLKMTGETPEVRSKKRKPRMLLTHRTS